MLLTAIRQIATTVQDVERAVVFYRDRLGLPLLFQAPPKLAFFDCGGVRLMLAEAAPGEEVHGRASVLYFKVDDIHAAHGELAARGVDFKGVPHMIAKMADHDLWLAEFRDTEGNALALMSEVPHSATV
jgi:methylmalonyl-CoA/ethylmalonyl-CoA epimerase